MRGLIHPKLSALTYTEWRKKAPMKQLMQRVLQSAIMAALSLQIVYAGGSDHIDVPFVESSVTIDGQFDTGEWDNAFVVFVEGTTPQTNPGWNPLDGDAVSVADCSYDLYLMHDGESLYVAFDVTDDDVSDDYQSTRPDHTEVWNDDCTEVFIDADLDRDVTESTGGSPADDRDWREGQQPHFGVNGQHHWENNSGYKDKTWWASTQITAKGYRTEYRFALRGADEDDGNVDYNPIETGDTIGFSALVNDDDFGGDREDQVAWIGGGNNDSLYRSQNFWGTITLTPPPGYIPYGIGTRAANESIDIDTLPGEGPVTVRTERVFPRLSFESPLLLIESPDDSERLFVVEQRGRVRTFVKDVDPAPGDVSTFLDVTSLAQSHYEGGGGGEEGLLGLAFDPGFQSNGEFYVYYTVREGDRRSRISRFTENPPGSNSVSLASEEVILEIPQPDPNHNGGMIAFGPDGYLYIGMGDGGGVGDNTGAGNNAQNTTNLLGSMLRIDVRSAPDVGLEYKIPPDNPFIDGGPAGAATRKEIYAYGLRNPWRWSFDMQQGTQFLADVGQELWEEVNVIKSGHNYGWRIMEGNHCYNPSNGCDQTGLTLPIAEYNHSEGISITGGFVYYGSAVPALYGRFIYGDYSSARIWAVGYDTTTEVATEATLIGDLSGFPLGAFGQDQSGEVYLLNLSTGAIYGLVPGDSETPDEAVETDPSPPVAGSLVTIIYDSNDRLLAGEPNINIHMGRNGWTNVFADAMTNVGGGIFEYDYDVPFGTTVLDMVFNNGNGTWDNNEGQDWHIAVDASRGFDSLLAYYRQRGAFPGRLSDVPALLNAGLGIDQTNYGIIPYEPSAKLWSDNALKERFIAIPGLEQAGFQLYGGWDFPNETVIIKNFILPLDDRDPEGSAQRIETRLLVRNSDEWHGYSYEWNEEETDAVLLTTNKERPFEITDQSGATFDYDWTYPSSTQCQLCHTDAAGNLLGLTTAQMNFDYHFPEQDITDNQLRTYDHISIFADPGMPDVPANLPQMPDPADTSASIRDRARAYLAANCAHCHQPGGGGPVTFDLRWQIEDGDSGIINGNPSSTLGIENAKLIAPGDPTRSVIYRRVMTMNGAIRMPPLATSRVDEDGAAVIRDWILSLQEDGTDTWLLY